MKIAICYDRANFEGGGTDRTSMELANAFMGLGHKVVLIYRLGEKSKNKKINSFLIKCPAIPLIGSLFYALKVFRVIDKLNPDLVIAQLSAAPIFGKLKQKHLYLIYNLELLEIINANLNLSLVTERPLIVLCEIFNSLRCDKILAINRKLAKQIFFCYRKKPALLVLGVDSKKFQPAIKTKTNNPPRIICVAGGDTRRKNLALLIQACQNLEVELRVTNIPFGKLPPNIINLGFISDQKLIKELQSADVFVLPSKQEGFGLATLEALACNIPVVITKTGIWEDVIKFRAGEIIEASIEGIRNGIQKALCTDYGNRPRTLAERYSWDQTAQSIIKIANSIKKT